MQTRSAWIVVAVALAVVAVGYAEDKPKQKSAPGGWLEMDLTQAKTVLNKRPARVPVYAGLSRDGKPIIIVRWMGLLIIDPATSGIWDLSGRDVKTKRDLMLVNPNAKPTPSRNVQVKGIKRKGKGGIITLAAKRQTLVIELASFAVAGGTDAPSPGTKPVIRTVRATGNDAYAKLAGNPGTTPLHRKIYSALGKKHEQRAKTGRGGPQYGAPPKGKSTDGNHIVLVGKRRDGMRTLVSHKLKRHPLKLDSGLRVVGSEVGAGLKKIMVPFMFADQSIDQDWDCAGGGVVHRNTGFLMGTCEATGHPFKIGERHRAEWKGWVGHNITCSKDGKLTVKVVFVNTECVEVSLPPVSSEPATAVGYLFFGVGNARSGEDKWKEDELVRSPPEITELIPIPYRDLTLGGMKVKKGDQILLIAGCCQYSRGTNWAGFGPGFAAGTISTTVARFECQIN